MPLKRVLYCLFHNQVAQLCLTSEVQPLLQGHGPTLVHTESRRARAQSYSAMSLGYETPVVPHSRCSHVVPKAAAERECETWAFFKL